MTRAFAALIFVLLTAPICPADTKADPLDALVTLLQSTDDAAVQRDVLAGMRTALQGRRDLEPPAEWSEVAAVLEASDDAGVRRLARDLSLLFGDRRTIERLRELAADPQADRKLREEAITDLARIRDPKLPELLPRLIEGGDLREAAVRALPVYEDAQTPALLLTSYGDWTPVERQAAVNTLASRPAWARALLEAVRDGRVPRQDVSTFVARQLAAFEDPTVKKLLEEVWGQVRPTGADKARLVQEYLSKLTAETIRGADLPHGRQVFKEQCAGCHQLFDAGRAVGPNLTGSQRSKPEYVLENLLDPNAIIGRDYQLATFATDAGRVVAGIVKEETENSLTVLTPTEDVILSKGEIAVRKDSNVSMMPEGLVQKLTETELRDLIAYLASPRQVPLPKGE